MVNYQVFGNSPFSDIVGGKDNAEKILKSMNYTKEICNLLGSEYTPAYVWNKNMPNCFLTVVGHRIADFLFKDKTWKPDEAFIEDCRQKIAKEIKK